MSYIRWDVTGGNLPVTTAKCISHALRAKYHHYEAKDEKVKRFEAQKKEMQNNKNLESQNKKPF